jgi:hypothetical protein
MKKYCLFLSLLIFINTCPAQQAVDSGSFLLHKFAQHIGKESYVLNINGNQLSYDVHFKFTDRGQPVPLHAKLVTGKDLEPVPSTTASAFKIIKQRYGWIVSCIQSA